MQMKQQDLILGGGVSGLAVGYASGLPVYEAQEYPGGICCSYYMRPGSAQRLHAPPADGEAYHFEIGGGHWLFGGEPAVLQFIQSLVSVSRYERKSAVFFPDSRTFVPYPLQNHLRFLGPELASKALAEMSARPGQFSTMKQWLLQHFGPTLCELFFFPFHQLYTSGLYDRIAPQDAYKSPVDLKLVRQGAAQNPPPVGYNATFLYPTQGLDALARRLAEKCQMHYGKCAVKIDPLAREVHFADGSSVGYRRLISTLPLSTMMQMTGLTVPSQPDPSTAVLVVNIGAVRAETCPDLHWLYLPSSRAGFHRVGFYSAVDRLFLPRSARDRGDRVSIYVERAYPTGEKPSDQQIAQFCQAVVKELQDWGFIQQAEVVDPTWIDVAYTWSWPDSTWKDQAIKTLQEHDIIPVGRYGRWIFQGIADSIRDGLELGRNFR